MRMIAITGKIKKGKLELTADPSLFPEGAEVILLARNDWNTIAGSDSTRYQLEQARKQLEQISREPERAKEIVGSLEVKK